MEQPVTFLKSADRFGRRATWLLTPLFLGALLLVALNAVLRQKGAMPLPLPFGLERGGGVLLLVLVVILLWVFQTFIPVLLGHRIGKLSATRRGPYPEMSPGEACEPMACRLLELGYHLIPPEQGDETGAFPRRFALMRKRSWWAELVTNDITRYGHTVQLDAQSKGDVTEVTATCRIQSYCTDTGEIEFCDRLRL